MTPNFGPFNALAAVAICAALAMLGSEINAQRPSVIRYEYSIVLPDPQGDDDADAPPSQDDHQRGSRHWHRSDPHDDDGDDDDHDGHPIREHDPDAAIPI